MFMYNPDEFSVFGISLKWQTDVGVVMQHVGGPQHPVVYALKTAPSNFTYASLNDIASFFRPPESGKFSRIQLLKFLWEKFAEEPELSQFEELVVAKDTKSASTTTEDDALVELLYDGLDPDERQDFNELKEHVQRKAATKLKSRWDAYKKEKEAHAISKHLQGRVGYCTCSVFKKLDWMTSLNS